AMNEREHLESFLSIASSEAREELAAAFSKISLASGQYLFFEGDQSSHLFLVESGVIEASAIHPDGKVYIFHFIFPGEMVGEEAVFGNEPHPFSAAVRKNAVLWKISKEDFLEVMSREPSISAHMLEVMGKRLCASYIKSRCIAGETVRNRVICVLLKSALKGSLNPDCPEKIDPPLTNRDISALIGSTEETVSRVMSRLKKQGVITTKNKHIVVLEPRMLARLMEKTN
ncbi:MAG: Crp/Fnr family transcriptional regulator, partial [Actinomycetota bacterium]|nr:Crp/Fnr family transcriptional regulator [Actinomycetota bacterium]